ncbi:MAG TPA: 4Fe-4S dicluster domain-containing protein [Steroidobacteraceae bacterium]|nr:4Fe-4S dicluster domain-containing protein [Steroidobacteraceae bacterium]
MNPGSDPKWIVGTEQLQAALDLLASRGYQVLGPTVRDGAIVYDSISSLEELPRGWTDRQEAGTYRLEKRRDGAYFGYAVGPQSWKRFLHPPLERLWQMRRDGDNLSIEQSPIATKFAFLGVRACELHALSIQDKVYLGGPYRDTSYQRRREDNFIVAVNCGEPGGTCFCVSMGTGPRADRGFDLALTELSGEPHQFLLQAGSAAGSEVLSQLSCRPATAAEIEAADAIVANTADRMGRTLDTNGIRELLQSNLEHPRWDEVAQRCLSCTNCTMVCPTCFCTTVEDHTDLSNQVAIRERKWDSCFTLDFSYLHGGSVRKQTRSRYRQWLTHKLANWIDQFGTSGCVGCGRCITWCPVGIDITAEVAAIRATPATSQESGHGGA